MLTYLDANGQTYLSLLPTSSQVAMSRIYVGLCTIVPLNGKSSIHLLFPCPDATFDSRPPLHQSRWLSREKLQVLFLPLAGTAGGTSAFSFCLLPFFGCSGAKLVTLVTVSPELQKKKKKRFRWSQRLFIAENQNGKGTSDAQKLLKAPCGSVQGRATSQLDRKCLTLSPEMSTSPHSLLTKIKMMRWDGLRLLMGCSKFKFSRGVSLLTLLRDV